MSEFDSEETRNTADSGAASSDANPGAGEGAPKATKASLEELTETIERISSQVADSARTAWDSEQRKEVQDSVVRALSGVAAAIEEQVKKISETEDAKRFTAKMEETTDKIADQVRGSKTFQDVADGLVKGFSAAAVSIEKWLRQQEAAAGKGPAAPSQADDGSQEIVIENRSVSTPPVAAPNEVTAPEATARDNDDQLTAPDNIVHF